MTAKQFWDLCQTLWLLSYVSDEIPTPYASQLSFQAAKLKFTRVYENGDAIDHRDTVHRYHIAAPKREIIVERRWSPYSGEAQYLWVVEPTDYELAELILLLPGSKIR